MIFAINHLSLLIAENEVQKVPFHRLSSDQFRQPRLASCCGRTLVLLSPLPSRSPAAATCELLKVRAMNRKTHSAKWPKGMFTARVIDDLTQNHLKGHPPVERFRLWFAPYSMKEIPHDAAPGRTRTEQLQASHAYDRIRDGNVLRPSFSARPLLEPFVPQPPRGAGWQISASVHGRCQRVDAS